MSTANAVGTDAVGTDAVGTDAVGTDAVARMPWARMPWHGCRGTDAVARMPWAVIHYSRSLTQLYFWLAARASLASRVHNSHCSWSASAR